ncbi:MAG TPA: HAMP domain-containing sensor histidine kinase [Phycisphaerae bacterium]|nr:HAMP domain-containing sensor histidine kinase [Phycisphaerae bacterium]
MPDTEQKWRTVWTFGGIVVIGAALVLAGAGTVLAIRQTQSLARLRIADLRQEAQLLRDKIDNDTVPRIERFLERTAVNLRTADLSHPFRHAAPPEWISEVYLYDPDATSIMLDRWKRTGANGWKHSEVRWDNKAGTDQVTAGILSHLLPPFLAAQFNPRPVGVQFISDMLDDGPMVIAHIADTQDLRGQTIVAARIDLPAFGKLVVEPELTSHRIGVQLVMPDDVARLRRALPWHEDLGPMAPMLWLSPTPEFIHQQHRVIWRQTIMFIVGTLLVMTALVAVMWAMWRLLQRELALSRMKQSFVADVSHELKTPLALIRLFGETLMSGRVPTEEKKREYYEIITRESDRLTNLINNILDFARIDAGKKRYTFHRTNVAAIVRDTYEAYKVQLDHAGFEHQLVIADELPEIACDRDAVAQALINLINNAMKYHDGSDKFLGIDVAPETRRGRHGVLISVSDRGIGIRPEDRNRLFTDFYRANDERVRSQRGAGLGLALVKHIVQGHSGIVDVESRLVKGSTFRIFLPTQPDAAPPEESADADDATSA